MRQTSRPMQRRRAAAGSLALSLLALAGPLLLGGCQQAESARLNQLLQGRNNWSCNCSNWSNA